MTTSTTPTDAQAVEAKRLQNRVDELQSKQEEFNKRQTIAQNNITRNERLLAEGKVTPEFAAERIKIANQEINYYNAQIQKNQAETAQIQSQLANLPAVQAQPVNAATNPEVAQPPETVVVAPVSAPATIESTNIDTTGDLGAFNQGDAEQAPTFIEPLSEPPDVPTDEFTGVEEQIVSRANALQEPPALTEEESQQAASDFTQEFAVEDYEPVIDPDTDPGISDADLGELGINTDLPTEASLGELGINTALPSGQLAAARASGPTYRAPLINTGDWRVRLQLAPGANYLYAAADPGILKPLQGTGGILFPYLPTVSVGYTARYDDASLTHTNYKILQYMQSTVDNVSIGGDFTAQSTEEADYVLAVIHFFRTITKMFYGQDNNPRRGTPPPLCYLTGYGEFQYSNHPLVITGFTYSLPNDVDYIRAGQANPVPGTSPATAGTQNNNSATAFISAIVNRVRGSSVPVGGLPLQPQWRKPPTSNNVTYVPTKISISISAIPVVSRADVSREFSVRDYATGKLTRGRTNANGRGFW